MGYDRTFPWSAVFGPREYGGLNLNNLYTEQCMQKTTMHDMSHAIEDPNGKTHENQFKLVTTQQRIRCSTYGEQ
jgi:hypothetical protein